MSEEDGFFSRWSRRKVQARHGDELPAEPLPAVEPPAPVAVQQPEAPVAEPVAEAPPPPTLDDVSLLTPQSDFRRFVAGDVQPEVKNAALKKLFADPHYNVMDGLDVYIDDYSKPDPIPPSMLRQLVQTKFLEFIQAEPEPPAVPNEDPDLRLQPLDDAGRTGPDPGVAEDPGREH